MSEVRVRLTGRDAELGRVAARDFARLLLGVEAAVARAAGHVMGRQVKATGRRGKSIEDATRFRLVSVETGSVVGVLELPAVETDPGALELDDARLGELALDSALAVASGQAHEQPIDVAAAFVRLADDIGIGSRFDALTLERDRGGDPRIVATVDRRRRDQLRDLVEAAPPLRDDSLIGVLVEADFERHTARLRTPDAHAVSVSFDRSMADEIQEALRRQTELVGSITYDPRSLEARTVELREIVGGDQLTMTLDPGGYWRHATIVELAREQGVGPIEDVERLRDLEASDEEVDAFLAALHEM